MSASTDSATVDCRSIGPVGGGHSGDGPQLGSRPHASKPICSGLCRSLAEEPQR